MLDWKMVRRRWRYAGAKLAAAMASLASPLQMRERGRGNERERADGRVMAVLKSSSARLVGPVPTYGR